MNIKLDEVSAWARQAQQLFDLHKDDVTGYDDDLDDPWEADVLEPAIDDVENMVETLGLRKISKEDTAARNGFMNDELPLINDLEFAAKRAIKAGTVTVALSAFALPELRKAIQKSNINSFHSKFLLCMSYVTPNATALRDKGFTTPKKNLFQSNHDSAFNLQGTKRNLKVEIGDLSAANREKVNTCITITQGMIDSIFAYAKSISDKDLMKRATGQAILREVRPTPVKKPRMRNVGPTETVIYQRNISGTKTMQFTVKSDEIVKLGRSTTITGAPTATIDLLPGRTGNFLKKEIPGDGEFIKLINGNLRKARVEVFVISPKG